MFGIIVGIETKSKVQCRYFTANNLSCAVTDDPAVFTSEAMGALKLMRAYPPPSPQRMASCGNKDIFDVGEMIS